MYLEAVEVTHDERELTEETEFLETMGGVGSVNTFLPSTRRL